ncbi:Protein of unknown function [Marininema mesophilum]|uniref:DUF4446 domain-containing protein n=1 Tax=Marininema mesophilum TaxID=1048340 RepID=A0A1H3AEX6_9BACL|nr:DUF4446 family protein [Marininema mesophilum]SDX28267.1 Protein of unknown function [Marininema mesophilum]
MKVELIYEGIQRYLPEVILVVVALQVILLIWGILTTVRLGKQKRMIRQLARKLGEGKELKSLLESEEIDGDLVIAHLQGIHDRLTRLKGKIGLVRYNAIGERASDMSFSLALLDENKDGIVMSSLFSNQGVSYIYSKPVHEGGSTHRLSKEEEQAITQALQPAIEAKNHSVKML